MTFEQINSRGKKEEGTACKSKGGESSLFFSLGKDSKTTEKAK